MAIERLGPYLVKRQLGQGGMGTVYEAVNEQSGQVVAVKVLSQLLGTHENFRARFESEVETLKRLKHPNIVQLIGFGEQEGHLFYAMELVDGTSLHEELRTGRRFTWQEVLRFGITLSAALKLAHDSGIIHRDLKPANVMLTRDGQIKLMDFGIARLFGATQLTADGGIVGTIDYMAPEQAEAHPVTPRSDLYGLGAVFYALLSGRPPFIGKTLSQIVHALRFDAPLPINRLAPDTPDELARVVDQLLEKDPKKRIPTALILGNRLKAIEHGLLKRAAEFKPEPEPDLEETVDDEYRLADNPHTVFDKRPGVTQPGSDGTPPTRMNRPEKLDQTDQPVERETVASGAEPPSPFDDALSWGDMTHEVPARTSVAKTGLPGSNTRNRPTLADEPASTPLAVASHFTTIDEDERRRIRRQHEEIVESRRMAWVQGAAIVLIVCLLCFGLWFLNRPASANQLYARIAAVAAAADFNRLEDVESDINLFLSHYSGDERASEVRDWKEQVVAQREARKLARRAKRSDQQDSLTTCERLYAEAAQMVMTNPELALVQLRALVDVFGGVPDADEGMTRALGSARQQIPQLEALVRRQQDEDLALLERRLDWANARRAEDAAAAEGVYRGIVRLYSSKPWAEPMVQRAQAALDEKLGAAQE